MRSYRPVMTTAVAALAAVLLPAACGGSDPGGGSGADQTPEGVRLYGGDKVMRDGFGAGLIRPEVLSTIKGTSPGGSLPTGFTNRLLEVEPSLETFRYAGEAYDAVAISALAAELAGTPDPEVVRDYVVAVTTGGERCTTVAACLELARAGEQPEYRGASLQRGGLTELGEPAAASYATLHFDTDGTIDDAKTEFVGAGEPAATPGAEAPPPGPRPTEPPFLVEPLRFGGLLPETGAGTDLAPAMVAGVELAIEEINDAGGVFGVDVEWFPGDDGTSDVEVARDTLASHVADEVHVVIGAGASGTTEAVLPDVVAAERILFSPSSTRTSLRDAGHDGYFFRTAPPDDLQGAALADVLLRDGAERVVIVARDQADERALQAEVDEALQEFGLLATGITLLEYQLPDSDELPVPGRVDLAEEVVDAEPDAVLVIGSNEAAQVVQAMIDAGLPVASGPGTVTR